MKLKKQTKLCEFPDCEAPPFEPGQSLCGQHYWHWCSKDNVEGWPLVSNEIDISLFERERPADQSLAG